MNGGTSPRDWSRAGTITLYREALNTSTVDPDSRKENVNTGIDCMHCRYMYVWVDVCMYVCVYVQYVYMCSLNLATLFIS